MADGLGNTERWIINTFPRTFFNGMARSFKDAPTLLSTRLKGC